MIRSLTAVTLLAAPPAGELATLYPDRPVLNAFEDACSSLKNIERTKRALRKSGWRLFEPQPEHPLYDDLQFERSVHARAGNPHHYKKSLYRKTVSGRSLTLSLSESRDYGGPFLERHCRVSDFTAEALISPATSETWAGVAPAHTTTTGFLQQTRWFGFFKGHQSTEVSFMSRDHPDAGSMKALGLSLHTWWTDAPPGPVINQLSPPPPHSFSKRRKAA